MHAAGKGEKSPRALLVCSRKIFPPNHKSGNHFTLSLWSRYTSHDQRNEILCTKSEHRCILPCVPVLALATLWCFQESKTDRQTHDMFSQLCLRIKFLTDPAEWSLEAGDYVTVIALINSKCNKHAEARQAALHERRELTGRINRSQSQKQPPEPASLRPHGWAKAFLS